MSQPTPIFYANCANILNNSSNQNQCAQASSQPVNGRMDVTERPEGGLLVSQPTPMQNMLLLLSLRLLLANGVLWTRTVHYISICVAVTGPQNITKLLEQKAMKMFENIEETNMSWWALSAAVCGQTNPGSSVQSPLGNSSGSAVLLTGVTKLGRWIGELIIRGMISVRISWLIRIHTQLLEWWTLNTTCHPVSARMKCQFCRIVHKWPLLAVVCIPRNLQFSHFLAAMP